MFSFRFLLVFPTLLHLTEIFSFTAITDSPKREYFSCFYVTKQ